jgi:hypothetical protein
MELRDGTESSEPSEVRVLCGWCDRLLADIQHRVGDTSISEPTRRCSWWKDGRAKSSETRIIDAENDMRHVRPGIVAVPIALSMLLIVSCDTGNRSPLASIRPATFGDPHGLMRVSIAGNVSLTSIGETSRFTSIATFNDGGSKDVTSEGRWQSSDTGVMTVSDSGEATVVGFGTCVISFEYQQQRASVNVRTGPPAITVSGRVREPGGGSVALAAVVDTLSGRSAVTGRSGDFVITDLPQRQVRLKVEKAGYETREVETSASDVDVPIQRVVRITAGETVTPAQLAPNDVEYVLGKDLCTCRLIRVVVPRAGTVGIRISWPQEDMTLHLLAEGVTANGTTELTANIPVTGPRELVIYFGRLPAQRVDYVKFTLETSMR